MNYAGKRGCIVLLVLLILFAGIYFYLVRETEETTPSPSQGSLPPPSNPSTPQGGKQPMRPLPSDPAG